MWVTLTLHTYSEEKRARVRQMWLRTGSVRTKHTSPYVEILAEASTAADGVLWREPSDFSRCGYATLGLSSVEVGIKIMTHAIPNTIRITLFTMVVLRIYEVTLVGYGFL